MAIDKVIVFILMRAKLQKVSDIMAVFLLFYLEMSISLCKFANN